MSDISAAYRLRLPGPTAVPERVRQAVAQPVINHRGPEFRALLSRCEDLIKPVLGTNDPVVFFASSGTGVMEASLVNVLRPRDKVLVCVNGQFGERFASIARSLQADVDVLDIPWGNPVDPEDVKRQVLRNDYRAVIVVQNESSTGVVSDLAAIGSLFRDSSSLLIVDSVSGLGGIEMRQDEWGIDIVVSSSQKALMCPPGLGLVSISEKAWEVIQRENGMPRFYWDFRKAVAALDKSETPFTAPVSLINGLNEALEMMHEEGLSQVLDRHRRLSMALREGCKALGLAPFGQAAAFSHTVVALEVPTPLKGSDIVRRLYQRYGTVIAGSRNKLDNKVIRIGTMGAVIESDILTDLLHLEGVLTGLGHSLEPAAGVRAATEFLQQQQLFQTDVQTTFVQ